MKQAIRLRSLPLVLLLMVLVGTLGCGKSPSEPAANVENTYDLFASLTNTAGGSTLVEAQVLLDGVVIDDETSTNPTSDIEFAVGGDPTIAPGGHTLQILLVKQTPSAPTTYTAPKFAFSIFSCLDGVFSDDGNPGPRSIQFKSQTASLVAGQGFTYQFNSPDCTIDSDDAVKRSHRSPAGISAPLGNSQLSRPRRPGV